MIAPEEILAALQHEDWKLEEISRLRRKVAELERAIALRDNLITIEEGMCPVGGDGMGTIEGPRLADFVTRIGWDLRVAERVARMERDRLQKRPEAEE